MPIPIAYRADAEHEDFVRRGHPRELRAVASVGGDEVLQERAYLPQYQVNVPRTAEITRPARRVCLMKNVTFQNI